ncbi:hypothetical protein BLD25_00815 [Candidatus Gracilibacteria bacterium GN02-872]|nr:hypothetical protein BLD25_00815 [Candidatus Gracilibacteria bacterium GN02-872]RKW24523.1 MAG: hypothetical protein D8B46_01300 [Candidatus Gracilibacteria bacterium]
MINFYEQAFAANTSPLLSSTTDPGDIVLLVISIFVLVAGVASILFILWGGLLMILSGGKEDKITPALNTIRYAIFGVIVTVATIFLFPILGRILGIDVDKYAKPSRIFEKIDEIGNKIFGSNSSSYNSISNVPEGELPDDYVNLDL